MYSSCPQVPVVHSYIDEKTNQHFSCKILLFVFLWRMYAVLQCKWMCTFYTFNYTSSLPQRALFFRCFTIYEVINLKNESEEKEAIIVQPNPWLPMLNWANKTPMKSRGCSVTSQGELNCDNPVKRTPHKKMGSLLCPGQNRSHDIVV